ncbi:mannitol-1-phosphate dehydrogenase [Pyrrhoderma noxium]|uniref:alcohol dehydrogenase n=1 Tax=Pyrrhoderma noxium TaxID=2282107 RepID=A0A286UHU0_9AGAM|nr:mannitol-1-phosphate dehydrogenase [Pyrrhoderma noxium]
MTLATIPPTQRAYVLDHVGEGGKLTYRTDQPVTQPKDLLPGQCLVHLTHSGVCHSDLTIKRGVLSSAGLTKRDLVGGHEGVGTVVAIGEHTRPGVKVKVGDRVGVKWIADTCNNCAYCQTGDESFCADAKKSGHTIDGTFSEYIVSYIEHVTPIPENLDSASATAIMCAGLTVFSALRQSDTHVGDWIVIPGAGGGLGHLAIQYAVAMGLRVIAIDTGEAKKSLALSLGAEKWIDFRAPLTGDLVDDVYAATNGLGAHAVLVTSGENAAYAVALKYLRSRGRLICVGLPPNGLVELSTTLVAARGLTIRGVLVGNRQVAKEAIDLAAAGKVKVFYTLRGLSELERVYEELESGKVAGRIVLDVTK